MPKFKMKLSGWPALLAAVVLVCSPVTGPVRASEHAQPNLEAQLAAMKKLYPFAGTWLGEGWFTLRGERTELVQGVTVSVEMKGQVMTTRDIILRRVEPAVPPASATFGVWSYDDLAGEYLFRSYFGAGFRDYDMQVPEPGLLIATGETERGLGRLTMDVRDGVWREKAERSADGGETWALNYEIVMRRYANPLGDPGVE
jgi:hypothetical protein